MSASGPLQIEAHLLRSRNLGGLRRHAHSLAQTPSWLARSRWRGSDDLANYDVHRVDERNAWQELGDFDEAEQLSDADLMRLRGLVSKLRWIDSIILANWPEEAERSRELGIYPKRDPGDPLLNRGVCSTFLPTT